MGIADDYLRKEKEEQDRQAEKEEEEEEEEDEEDEDELEISSVEETLRAKMEGDEESDTEKHKEDKGIEKGLFFKWWIKPSIIYAFRHPLVTSRLEKLMGSNCVSLTDREFMQRLQHRILIEYGNAAEKRIRIREMDEMERVKNLVLTGKVPFSKAPPEMFDHPVMVIERYCQKLIAERRAKIKVPKVNIPNHLYWDDTIDPPSGLSIEKGHMFRDSFDRVCIPPEKFLSVDDEEDIELGYMLTNAEFETLRYEDPNVRRLKECQTVEELYELSDEVIGNLKTMEGRVDDDTSSKMSAQTM
ncbi:uncharacterized protein LOC123312580 [Coccinella septempunctata]|uniref:uncharacterized protein LOC123312580 n=1 Tax=Coccinella septempunctata TaxID=41139 RepID=UPI001D05EEE0|nr:uncharacterized protein LOC123312580 [Coccinella septempunctata]